MKVLTWLLSKKKKRKYSHGLENISIKQGENSNPNYISKDVMIEGYGVYVACDISNKN